MGVCQSTNDTATADQRAKKENSQKNQSFRNSVQINVLEDIKINKRDFIIKQAGSLNDHYKMKQLLGQGGYGEVKLCVHKITNVERAVKIMKKSSMSEQSKIWFENEIEILASLDHPNIVKLYEIYEDANKYYLVQEICNGGELFDEIINRKRFQEEDAAIVMQQVIQAIAYCHENNIVHRDLKPENILLSDHENGKLQVKVIDFGASQIFDPSQKLTEKFGTVYYISPEVLKGNYTASCDLWSLGVILFVMLCGEPPFNGQEDDDILKLVVKGKFSFSQKIWASRSQEVKDLITKMIEYNPKERITAQQALEHPWFKKTLHPKLDMELTESHLRNLQNFRAEMKLQEAVLTFIVCQFSSKKEEEELMNTFKAIDTNGNGTISKDELLEGYMDIYKGKMKEEDIRDEVERIWSQIDIDKSGKIDYTEWAIGTMNKQSILTKAKLQKAFDMFDKDGSGSISADEIKSVLGVGKRVGSEKIWEDVIKEVDVNKDGEISYDEFEIMMTKFLTSSSGTHKTN